MEELEKEFKEEGDEDEERRKFVEEIMNELRLKGKKKRRLIAQLAERYGNDKRKVMFEAKRAFIDDISKVRGK